ncbi:hypothetical protein ACIPWF_16835 [Paenarthrobacter sp. NPDC089989]
MTKVSEGLDFIMSHDAALLTRLEAGPLWWLWTCRGNPAGVRGIFVHGP